MKKILFILFTCGLLASCTNKNTATIDLQIDGLCQKPVILNVLNINKLDLVDTLIVNEKGSVRYKVTPPFGSPNFYYANYNGKTIASLVVKPGDKIKVEADSLGNKLIIKGSEESLLFGKVLSDINKAQKKFDSLTVQLLACNQIADAEGVKRLRLELGSLYVKEKQAAVKGIIQNPYSFTNITQLYRQFNENLPLFAALQDGIYYSQVCDSLKALYPNSPYISALEQEAVKYNNYMELQNKMSSATESAFPEIAMKDVKGSSQSLSSLLGRPFMLLFWSRSDTAQKMLNAELEEVYARLKDKGFQIYSVCIDTDRTSWAQIVKRFGWINVCDGLGAASPALMAYNVSKLPAMFLFNKEGEIVGRDIYDIKRLEAAIANL